VEAIVQEDLDGLRQQLYASYPGDRAKAARQLAMMGAEARAALSDLQTRLKDPSNGVRDAARVAIAAIQRQAVSGTRPKWQERAESDRNLTTPEFILAHYKDQIVDGTLTAAALREADEPLYFAFLHWQRTRQLPDGFPHIPSVAEKRTEVFTLKPGIWGMSIDLKEIGRRGLSVWRRLRG
jgi:hypothetical protein